MLPKTRQTGRRQGGSAMILVVVVTVLLAVVGVMFVMMARVSEMESAAVIDNSDLNAAADAVVTRISTVLVEDLFDGGTAIEQNGPHFTWPGEDPDNVGTRKTPWLAVLEPNSLNGYTWDYITNLNDGFDPLTWDRQPLIVSDYQLVSDIVPGSAADADGDGVADSMWMRIADQTTSRGRPVFAAVRILDNCAMLNLNTAFGFFQREVDARPWHSKPWFISQLHADNNLPYDAGTDFGREIGCILSEVNYSPFLRGSDFGQIQRIRLARNSDITIVPYDYHVQAIMKIESPGNGYTLFDIGDELEMRNRYLLTSRALSRFEKEDISFNTYDFGRGEFVGGWQVATRVKRTPYDGVSESVEWGIRVNNANFDDHGLQPTLYPYYYDRRHISTFYSFDRPLRTGTYASIPGIAGMAENVRSLYRPEKAMPIDLRSVDFLSNTPAARQGVLHVLYALREVYGEQKAVQNLANIIDYVDADDDITVLDKAQIDQWMTLASGGTETDSGVTLADPVYGFERQPFISEIYCQYVPLVGGSTAFALELVNPYSQDITLDNWQIRLGTAIYPLTGKTIPAAVGTTLGRLTLWAASAGYAVVVQTSAQSLSENVPGFGLGTVILGGSLSLERQDPVVSTDFLVVDRVSSAVLLQMVGDNVIHSYQRDDNQWRFANAGADAYQLVLLASSADATLGLENGVSRPLAQGYQLPVANTNQPFYTLGDFEKVLSVSYENTGTDPNTITTLVAKAVDESDIRYDVESTPELLDYICFMDRPEGSLPGRININTAALHVIAAAIPPQLVMSTDDTRTALDFARAIVDNRPYRRISDLLTIQDTSGEELFKKFALDGAPNVGDTKIEKDFEERDWILSRLANIFTVRSDTFTAYILIRLGADGPQRRMLAIFDRTNCWAPDDRPRLIALQPVPDPR